MHYFEEKAHGVYAACVIGILLCVFSILLLQRQYVLNLIVENIGYEREKYFGDLIFDLYKKELKIVSSPEANTELEKITSLLNKNNDLDKLSLKFYIIDDDSVNAAAMMGGHILVNKGLILKSKNSEQLLAVLAHEIAHVKNRDVLKSIFSQIGFAGFFALLFGDVSSVINDMAMTSARLINLKFSREVEAAADLRAIDILSNARISCDGFIEFFTQDFADNNKMLTKAEFLMSHPVSESRVLNINNYISVNKKCQQSAVINYRIEDIVMLL